MIEIIIVATGDDDKDNENEDNWLITTKKLISVEDFIERSGSSVFFFFLF